MKSIKKIVIVSIVTVSLVGITAWKLGSNKEKMNSNAAVANQKTVVFPVTTINPKLTGLNESFKVNGILNPLHTLSLVSEVAGRVQTVTALNGQYVNKGQVIALLDHEQIQIDLKVAQANYEKAQLDLVKYKTMLESNAITKQQLEEQKINLINAEAKLATLNRQLKNATIVAPISGSINKLFLEVGSYLSPGSSIAEIIDIKELKMQVSLLDKDIIKVKTGEVIKITPDLFPNTNYSGKIVSVGSKSDDSRKFQVEIQFSNNSNMDLKGGMTGLANFEKVSNKNSLVIPLKCIVGSLKDPKVFVINGNKANLKKIVVGYTHGDYIEVISGLNTNEEIVETGQLNIVNGSNIQIIK